MGQTPSRGGYGNARSMAKIASMMANKGKFGGKQILKKETWEDMHSEFDVKDEPFL